VVPPWYPRKKRRDTHPAGPFKPAGINRSGLSRSRRRCQIAGNDLLRQRCLLAQQKLHAANMPLSRPQSFRPIVPHNAPQLTCARPNAKPDPNLFSTLVRFGRPESQPCRAQRFQQRDLQIASPRAVCIVRSLVGRPHDRGSRDLETSFATTIRRQAIHRDSAIAVYGMRHTSLYGTFASLGHISRSPIKPNVSLVCPR